MIGAEMMACFVQLGSSRCDPVLQRSAPLVGSRCLWPPVSLSPHPVIQSGIAGPTANEDCRFTSCSLVVAGGAAGFVHVLQRRLVGKWPQRTSRRRVIGCGGTATTTDPSAMYGELEQAVSREEAEAVLQSLLNLKGTSAVRLFASYPRKLPSGRTVSDTDLRSIGIRAPDKLVTEQSSLEPAIILATVFGIAGVVSAVVQPLPWLTFAFVFATLASIVVGAFKPEVFAGMGVDDAEERRRRVAHEAAHFLVGYLLGVPIRSYSLDAERGPQVEFEERFGPLANYKENRNSLDVFCVVASSGIAGEGLLWEGSRGGAADLVALSDAMGGVGGAEFASTEGKVTFTRWGVFYAASMLKLHQASWEALREAMAGGANVCECIKAVERAHPQSPA